jgi:hypothetical protein
MGQNLLTYFCMLLAVFARSALTSGRMKHLVPVTFTPMPDEGASSNDSGKPGKSMCPSCQKELTSTTNIFCTLSPVRSVYVDILINRHSQ